MERKTKQPLCRVCGCSDSSNFYWSNKSVCKACVLEKQAKYRQNNLEAIKEYDRKRSLLPHRVEIRRECAERRKNDKTLRSVDDARKKLWQEKNTLKRAAHIITGNAIRDGRLVKQPCIICGEDAEAHHEDYSYPMDVIWYCKKHHGERHRQINEEKRKKKI